MPLHHTVWSAGGIDVGPQSFFESSDSRGAGAGGRDWAVACCGASGGTASCSGMVSSVGACAGDGACCADPLGGLCDGLGLSCWLLSARALRWNDSSGAGWKSAEVAAAEERAS